MVQRKPSRRSALLVVDFVNLFDFENAQQLSPRAVRAAQRTAAMIGRLKRKDVPVIYANDNFGQWNSDFFGLVEDCFRKGGASADIVSALHPSRADFAILKPRHSAFYGTPLEFLLEELGIDDLILAGIAVDMCVFATAQDAHVRQYSLRVPADCVAGFTAAQERSALSHMARTLRADIRPARMKRTDRREKP